jgi:protein gp37
MGTNTAIPWAHHSWNPWQGCHKVSPGCLHCYMEREKIRYGQDPGLVVRSSPQTFRQPIAKHLDGTWHWKDGERVFACSWSDFFHEAADPWRADAWELIRRRPGLTFLLLTKRPERIRACLPPDWGEGPLSGYRNVWLGFTAEDQPRFDERWPHLAELALQGGQTFVSLEPLLGPVELEFTGECAWVLDWVIAGCESGPNRTPGRPAELDWFRSLRDQCQEASVPFFLKQAELDGRLVTAPALDGRQWLEVPGEGEWAEDEEVSF